MIDQENGIAVRDQIMHDTIQTHDVGRVQPDRRLVQHIEDARCPVANGSCQLHSLSFPGGKCRRSPVQCKVGEPQIHEPPSGCLVRFTDALCHRFHLIRHCTRQAGNPFDGFGEGHSTGFRKRNTHEFRCPGFLRKPCSATIRTNRKPQEFFYPLHAIFIFHL